MNDTIISHSHDIECHRTSDADWRFRSDWGERIQRAGLSNWFDPKSMPGAELIKSGSRRSVWRVPLDENWVYAKLWQPAPSFLSRIKACVADPPTRREWMASESARRMGVHAVRVVALGARRRLPRESVLVSEAVPDAKTLADAWCDGATIEHPADQRKIAGQLIEAVAKTMAHAHQRGFVHRDGHPGNLLVRRVADQSYEATFVDLYGASIKHRKASRSRAIDSLAQLDQYFQHHATRTQRWRFLQTYLTHRERDGGVPLDGAGIQRFALAIGWARARHGLRLAKHRDRRLCKSGKYFGRIALGDGWSGIVALRLERRHLFPEPEIPDRNLAEWRAVLAPMVERLGDSSTTDGALVGDGIQLVSGSTNGLADLVATILRGSSAVREFGRCHRARHRGENGDLILGYLEHRVYRLIDQSVIIRPA